MSFEYGPLREASRELSVIADILSWSFSCAAAEVEPAGVGRQRLARATVIASRQRHHLHLTRADLVAITDAHLQTRHARSSW